MKRQLLIWVLQTGEPLPSDDGTHRPMRAINLASALTSAGHNVILWGAAFNHQTKTHRYKRFKSIRYSENLEIRLIPSPGYKKNVSLERLYDHLILAKNLKTILNLEKIKPDVVFIGYPPIETAAVMTRWLKKRQIPCLLDVKDQWPSFMVDAVPKGIKGVCRMALFPHFYLAKRSMREATGLSSMADDFLTWALDFSGREKSDNDLVVPLTTIKSSFSDNEREDAMRWWEEHGVVNNGSIKIMFVGSHYPSLDFSPIFEVAALFLDEGIKCDFIICGHGELTESLSSKARNYDNIFFPGWVDRPKVEELAKISTALIAPFRDIDCFVKSLPNKIIDSLSLGLPIICPLKGEVERLIKTEDVGLTYDPNLKKSLYDCILMLGHDKEKRNKFAENAINLHKKRFSFEVVYGGLVRHMEKLVEINHGQ